jgi:hypothetical protein
VTAAGARPAAERLAAQARYDLAEASGNDFSLTVDRSDAKPGSWQWGIYRLGRESPIERSRRFFKTEATATSAGQMVFRRLMTDHRA